MNAILKAVDYVSEAAAECAGRARVAVPPVASGMASGEFRQPRKETVHEFVRTKLASPAPPAARWDGRRWPRVCAAAVGLLPLAPSLAQEEPREPEAPRGITVVTTPQAGNGAAANTATAPRAPRGNPITGPRPAPRPTRRPRGHRRWQRSTFGHPRVPWLCRRRRRWLEPARTGAGGGERGEHHLHYRARPRARPLPPGDRTLPAGTFRRLTRSSRRAGARLAAAEAGRGAPGKRRQPGCSAPRATDGRRQHPSAAASPRRGPRSTASSATARGRTSMRRLRRP
jgi:hypothetical protein